MSAGLPDLAAFCAPSRVVDLARGTSKVEAITTVAASFRGHPAIGNYHEWVKALHDREAVITTGIGGGVALPHAQHPANQDFLLAIGRSQTGVDFGAKDGKPVQVMVMMAAPIADRPTYLKVLASVAGRLHRGALLPDVLAAATPEDVIAQLLATHR